MASVVPRLSGKAGNFLVRFEMVTAISTGITIKCSRTRFSAGCRGISQLGYTL